jgi:hypothetical protein
LSNHRFGASLGKIDPAIFSKACARPGNPCPRGTFDPAIPAAPGKFCRMRDKRDTVTHRWPRYTATLANFRHFIRYKAATLYAYKPPRLIRRHAHADGQFSIAL